jgi:hypothetical protein
MDYNYHKEARQVLDDFIANKLTSQEACIKLEQISNKAWETYPNSEPDGDIEYCVASTMDNIQKLEDLAEGFVKYQQAFAKDLEMYEKDWCILTGRSIVSPHPHRAYTFEEFVAKTLEDSSFAKTFLKYE